MAEISLEVIGRYAVHAPIASGGMASVHLGRMVGPAGFAKAVALKRLRPELATDQDFVAMFVEEARLAADLHHPNIVATLDIVTEGGEVLLVMEHVMGESFAKLLRAAATRGVRCPPRIAAKIVHDALVGLHHAHEARTPQGEPLRIVHRDVSPQNIVVGVDGTARVVDFGIAKALGRIDRTRTGEIRGKLPYVAPELLERRPPDRQTDVYAAGVVLWEALAGQRLFAGAELEICAAILNGAIPPLSDSAPGLERFEAIVARATTRDRASRYASAQEFALALEQGGLASTMEVSEWVEELARDTIARRRQMLAELDGAPRGATVAVDAVREESAQVASPAHEAVAPSPPGARPRRTLALALAITFAIAAALAMVWSWRALAPLAPKDAPVSAPLASASPDARAPAEIETALVEADTASPPPAATPSAPVTSGSRPTRGPARGGRSAPVRGQRSDCTPIKYVDQAGHTRYQLPPDCRP